jgi:arsenate reductase (glutaredoxin)
VFLPKPERKILSDGALSIRNDEHGRSIEAPPARTAACQGYHPRSHSPLALSQIGSMILYGFKSCDMVRNAMKWLDAHHIAYTFVDYRREQLDGATIDDWFERAGWEVVFNRNSSAYKEMPEHVQSAVTRAKARALILENTNFIKRPLLDSGSTILAGFNAKRWAEAELR